MIRRLAQNLIALCVGSIVTLALLLFFSSHQSRTLSDEVSTEARLYQVPITTNFKAAIDIVERFALDSSGKTINKIPFGENDPLIALARFEPVETIEMVKKKAEPLAESASVLERGEDRIFLPLDSIRIGASAARKYPFSRTDGRLIKEFAASPSVISSMIEAIETSKTIITPTLKFSPANNGAVIANEMTPGTTGQSAFWIFRAIYRNNSVVNTPEMRRKAFVALVGGLVSVDQLIPRSQSNHIDASMMGPLNPAQVGEMNKGRLAATDTIGLISSMAVGSAQQLDVLMNIGSQGYILQVSSMGKGIFSVPMTQLLFSVFAGLVIASLLLIIMNHERKKAKNLTRRVRGSLKKIEKRTSELRESEARFKHLAESTNVIPWAADMSKQCFTYVGPQIQDLAQYPVDTWYSSGFWMHHIHPEDRQKVMVDGFRNLKEGQYATREYRIRAANGRVIHVRNMMTLVPNTSKKGKEAGKKSSLVQGFLFDVTEMKQAQAAVNEARFQAEAANKTKSEFLANMSHELRTPLNAVIGFSEIMKDGIFGDLDSRYQEYSENIHSSGKHLLDLINDVLDLSKIEAGKIELLEEETDVSALLSTCKNLMHERAKSSGLHIKTDISDKLPNLMADGRRLKQIMLNLMSNGIKFTAPGGFLTLSAGVDNEKGMYIAVQDTGVGMSAEELPKALEKFGQIDSQLAREHDGTGLGLPIANSLAEMHGGSLQLESEKNVGTKVTFWLPSERFIVTSETQNTAEAATGA